MDEETAQEQRLVVIRQGKERANEEEISGNITKKCPGSTLQKSQGKKTVNQVC